MKHLTRAEQLLIVSTVIGLLHHTDHVLRIDHSGWPFLPNFSPFTISLIVYPIIVSIFLIKRPWYRFGAALFIFIAVTATHIAIEPPTHLYHTWTYGSDLPWAYGQISLLGVQSPVLGVISVIISLTLSLVLLVTTIALYKEAKAQK